MVRVLSSCRAVSSVLKSASLQSTASVERSTLSTLSTLTSIRSPWSDLACIHKCSSAMKFLNWPLSWLQAQLFGIKSMILYGLAASAGPAEILRMALEMLLIASSLPFDSRVHLFADSLRRSLPCCCNVIKSAFVAMPACYCTTPAAAADLESLQVTSLAMALNRAPLATLFCGNLEPTRMRWKNCQVHTTTL